MMKIDGKPSDEPVYFPVSRLKLAIMSFFTLGIYEVYWFYRNWRFVRRNERPVDIWPLARGVFALFFCYALLRRVKRTGADLSLRPSFSPLFVTAGWTVLNLLSYVPEGLWVLSFFSGFMLLPVQKHINSINARLAPDAAPNDQLTWKNYAAILLGVAVNIVLFSMQEA